MEPTHIGVLGTGQMGRQIAAWFACRGFAVLAWDIQVDPSLDRAIRKIAMMDARRRGLKKADALDAVQRIQIVDDLAALGPCEIVFEAVVEDLAVKRDLISRLGREITPQPVIGSNTSSLTVSDLGESARDPSKVMGVHFFNPVAGTELVELAAGRCTAEETVDSVRDLLARLGKSPCRVPDIPGFLVNRLLFSMINEALHLLDTGAADARTIDEVFRAGTGLTAAPLQMADFIGLDVCLAILENLHAKTGDDKWRPPALLGKLVAEGALGRKTGRGLCP